MRKRIYALIIGVLFLLAQNVYTYAGTSTQIGYTSGGYSSLRSEATIYCGNESASATTIVRPSVSVTLKTTLNYTFYNAYNHIQTISGLGTSSVYVYNPTGTGGISASSSHTVDGGINWGSWSTDLLTYY